MQAPQETQPTVTKAKPKEKNPKKVEAGKKGAMMKKLKKEQREKEEKRDIDRVTYSEHNEKPMTITQSTTQSNKVEKHGNLINYVLFGIITIGVGYIGYQKYMKSKEKTESVGTHVKHNKLDMK